MPHPLFDEPMHEWPPSDDIPNIAGLHAVYLKESLPQNQPTLPSEYYRADRLLYIGESHDLNKILRYDHFESLYSKDSSLRQAIGALLKVPLNLTATPRSGGNTYNYNFNDENSLINWMCSCLEYRWIAAENHKSVTKELVRRCTPPLNYRNNPEKLSSLKEARAICRREAESS